MEVLDIFMRDGRFYVVLKTENEKRTFPRANFIWLQGNPSFKSIPKGYVIHHLDNDRTNDDITNLVLMQKHHHSAHHWKQKTITTIVATDRSLDTYCPVRRPSIYKDNRRPGGYYKIYFRELDEETGKQRPVYIYSDENGSFKTREHAEKFVKRIWKGPSQLCATNGQ